MSVNPKPEGMHTVTPCLIVDGAAQLIDFLVTVFDGAVTVRVANPDGSVMHAQVKIGDSTVMLGTPIPKWGPRPGMLYLYVPDVDAVYARALAAGAASLREPVDEFYGDRSAGVGDRWGNQWWIATHVEDVSEEEMERRRQELIASGKR